MQILKDFPLKHLNTFGIAARAEFYIELSSENDIKTFLHTTACRKLPLLIIGGGSNILLTKNFAGCVVHINTKGITLVAEDDSIVLIEVAAGEKWESLIEYCVNNNYYGLENLSGIPGQVGSSPIQNIGAYGVEVKDSIFEVHTIDLDDRSKKVFTADECRFGYRDSIFKQELKGKVLIEKVVFQLSKQSKVNLSYKGVKEEVQRISPDKVDLKSVSQAILNIRKNKIPDVKDIGSAGSFFKNPIIKKEQMDYLVSKFPDISYYKLNNDNYKLAAAWLIEQCGWKGYRKGDAGVNDKQPLILVNYGNATGKEIIELSQEIQRSVFEKFKVSLETEVNII